MMKSMTGLARGMAILGGTVLSALIVLTCLSILGRELSSLLHGDVMQSWAPGLANGLLGLGVGPINGDIELVEAGIAFAIFAFIPICTITAGHASVDILTSSFPDRVNRILRAVVDVVFAAVLILIAWRLYEGMLSKMSYGETSFLLEFPVWWGYAASLFGAVISAIVGTFVAGLRLREMWTGETLLVQDAGAGE